MPSTKQPVASRKIAVHNSMVRSINKGGAKKMPRIRAAKGDYGVKKLGRMGLIHTIDNAFDPEGKDRDEWQRKRMSPWSYSGKATPRIAVKGKGTRPVKAKY